MITLQDTIILYEEFKEFTQTASQHMFPMLALLDVKIERTIYHFNETSQKELEAMFRVINKVIHHETRTKTGNGRHA